MYPQTKYILIIIVHIEYFYFLIMIKVISLFQIIHFSELINRIAILDFDIFNFKRLILNFKSIVLHIDFLF